MRHIRFGMIGCGSVTEVKSGPAFSKIEGVSLDMVMRRDEAKLRDYARRHGIAHWSTDYRDLLNAPDIDAIYIATPPDSHAFYTLEAARMGKAVYVEKPMARNVAECLQMVEACRRADVPLFVAYYRRGWPKYLKARELIQGGALGEVHSFCCLHARPPEVLDPARAWLLSPEISGGGLLHDVGSHLINGLLFLLGDPAELQVGSAGRADDGPTDLNRPETHSAVLRFVSGTQGTLQLTYAATQQIDRLLVFGTKGSLEMAIMSNDPILLQTEAGSESLAFPDIPHVQQPYIEQVVRTLQGSGHLESTGAEGLLTQELIEAIDHRQVWRADS